MNVNQLINDATVDLTLSAVLLGSLLLLFDFQDLLHLLLVALLVLLVLARRNLVCILLRSIHPLHVFFHFVYAALKLAFVQIMNDSIDLEIFPFGHLGHLLFILVLVLAYQDSPQLALLLPRSRVNRTFVYLLRPFLSYFLQPVLQTLQLVRHLEPLLLLQFLLPVLALHETNHRA